MKEIQSAASTVALKAVMMDDHLDLTMAAQSVAWKVAWRVCCLVARSVEGLVDYLVVAMVVRKAVRMVEKTVSWRVLLMAAMMGYVWVETRDTMMVASLDHP
jgi:H2-forming N5,N10-methylenetetrahydromethanopterin dehydrogenase-like enzyme